MRFPFLQSMEHYSICNARCRVFDLKVVSLKLSVIPNNSGLLIQSNCNRTEYMCGPPFARFTVKGVQLNLIHLVVLLIQIYIQITRTSHVFSSYS